jgi:hypothetical protein
MSRDPVQRCAPTHLSRKVALLLRGDPVDLAIVKVDVEEIATPTDLKIDRIGGGGDERHDLVRETV